MAKFDITAAFQAAVGTAGNVSKLDTSREAIEYISLDKLEADPGNFYRLTGLEDLAANIELCGLQQPVRVRPTEGGRYMIVSGDGRPWHCWPKRIRSGGRRCPALWSGTRCPRSSGSCG